MSENPPSAAKNGTCVVPAWVTSGPLPETAALRMRSSWTSQPTTCTLTLMPVCAVNGSSSFCRSPVGLGLLGMVHIVRVTFCLAGPEAALLLLLSDLLLPPQAATAMAAVTTRAIAAGATAILLGTIFSSFGNKNVFGSRLRETTVCLGGGRHLLGGAALEPRATSSTGSVTRPVRSVAPSIRSISPTAAV